MTTRSRSLHVWVLVSALLCGLCAPVLAQGPDLTTKEADAKARRLYSTGVEFYEAGRYEAAVEAFKEAYRLSKRHVLLQNIASALERQGELGGAIDSLEMYLPYAPPDKRAALTRRIQAIRARKAKLDAKATASTSGPDRDPNIKTPPDDSNNGVTAPPDPVPASAGGYPAVLKWGTLGGGLALAVVGGVSYTLGELEHRALQDRIDAGEFPPRDAAALNEARALDDAAQHKKLLGYIVGGVGGALAITGVVLFATDDGPAGSNDVKVSVVPGVHAGGLQIQGRF